MHSEFHVQVILLQFLAIFLLVSCASFLLLAGVGAASKTLVVNNLSFSATEEALQSTFEKAVSIRIPQKDGRAKGWVAELLPLVNVFLISFLTCAVPSHELLSILPMILNGFAREAESMHSAS